MKESEDESCVSATKFRVSCGHLTAWGGGGIKRVLPGEKELDVRSK